MIKQITSIIVAVCILGSSVSVGAETIEINADTANKMVKEIESCRERQKQLEALKEAGVLKDQRIDILEQKLAVTSSIARDEKEYAELLAGRLKESDSFWREPALWLGIGILVTGLSVGVGIGLSR